MAIFRLSSSITLFVLTAKGREVDIDKGLALRADAYIPKLFRNYDLVEKVNGLLEQTKIEYLT